jgi:hypothetical protein
MLILAALWRIIETAAQAAFLSWTSHYLHYSVGGFLRFATTVIKLSLLVEAFIGLATVFARKSCAAGSVHALFYVAVLRVV